MILCLIFIYMFHKCVDCVIVNDVYGKMLLTLCITRIKETLLVKRREEERKDRWRVGRRSRE